MKCITLIIQEVDKDSTEIDLYSYFPIFGILQLFKKKKKKIEMLCFNSYKHL